MTWTLAVTNQKGGVGKTTTAVNLAASLADFGRRVLLIDLDPQGHATGGSGIDKHALESTVGDVLLGQKSFGEVCLRSEPGLYDVLPANGELSGAEFQLVTRIGREMRLRKALESVGGEYDFILIDCPPALNTLTINGLVAADDVLIPVQCEFLALEGLSDLLQTLEQVRGSVHDSLGIAGVLRTLYDARNRLAKDVSDQLLGHFAEKVFESTIPRNVRLAEAPGFGLPALKYDKSSAGAEAYLALARELIKRALAQGRLSRARMKS
ncbi:MAG: ParA family protein [Halothiobacillaceae bacterium]|jgi:chromosome partitioning protein|nr:ParA family protein [Halothiobacillaceae bacterium]MDY0050394.1 ParA family protein [Halothiobacillaceae bacterium]